MGKMLSPDLYLSAKRREKWLIAITMIALLIAGLAVAAVAALLPMKELVAFGIVTDRETGHIERMAEIEKIRLSDTDAITQSLLVRYVIGRETFDPLGGQERIDSVYAVSRGEARGTFLRLWSEESPEYLPKQLRPGDRVNVTVRSVSIIAEGVAQVRLTKTLTRDGRAQAQPFEATVGFGYEPRKERTLQALWDNPLGFYVSAYRIDAETLGGGDG